MKFLHTADLQLGARFTQFGDKADLLREARLNALQRILEIARERNVDAVLIAGDMFESNQVASKLVKEAFDILNALPDVPVIILPGNHDPLNGPACIWLREPFNKPPAHITVCTSREPVDLGEAVVLPSPITQKVSTKDPSLPLVELAAAAPKEKIKIGMTHGALAIEGKHQPNDHPIALDAASRARLDYLAAGHWHKPLVLDDGRLVMPGTPEPDGFEQGEGSITIAEIGAPGDTPRLEQLNCATLSWRTVTIDFRRGETPPEAVRSALAGVDLLPGKTVLRVEFTGTLSPDDREALMSQVAELTSGYAVSHIVDRTSTVLSEPLWRAWLAEHPLLAQVAADIDRARLFHTGDSPTVEAEELDELSLKDFQALCQEMNIKDGELDEGVFEAMTGLLTSEVSRITGEDTER